MTPRYAFIQALTRFSEHLFSWFEGSPRSLECVAQAVAGGKPRVFTPILTDALVRRGHTALALRLCEAHLRYLIDHPAWRMPSTSSPISRLAQPSPLPPIPHADKREALRHVLETCEFAGLRPFLCFGLLLGLVREGNFLPHDADLDIGFFYPDTSCADVTRVLQEAGYEITQLSPDPWPCRISARWKALKLGVDIVFFKREGPHLLTFARYMGKVLIRRRTSFNLQRTMFCGMEVWIPEAPERFLDENYGAWQKKAPYHHFILTSPLTDFSVPEVRYLLTTTVQNAVLRNLTPTLHTLIPLGVRHYNSALWNDLASRYTP